MPERRTKPEHLRRSYYKRRTTGRKPHLIRMIHDRFCCTRRFTAATGLRPVGSPPVASTYGFKYVSAARGSARQDKAGSPSRRRPHARLDCVVVPQTTSCDSAMTCSSSGIAAGFHWGGAVMKLSYVLFEEGAWPGEPDHLYECLPTSSIFRSGCTLRVRPTRGSHRTTRAGREVQPLRRHRGDFSRRPQSSTQPSDVVAYPHRRSRRVEVTSCPHLHVRGALPSLGARLEEKAYRLVRSVELEFERSDGRKRRAGIDDFPEVLRTAEVAVVEHVGKFDGRQ